MFCVQQVKFCRFDQADAPHMRRKILNTRGEGGGEGQGSEYMGGGGPRGAKLFAGFELIRPQSVQHFSH